MIRNSVLNIGDGAVAPLPPGTVPNVGTRFGRIMTRNGSNVDAGYVTTLRPRSSIREKESRGKSSKAKGVHSRFRCNHLGATLLPFPTSKRLSPVSAPSKKGDACASFLGNMTDGARWHYGLAQIARVPCASFEYSGNNCAYSDSHPNREKAAKGHI